MIDFFKHRLTYLSGILIFAFVIGSGMKNPAPIKKAIQKKKTTVRVIWGAAGSPFPGEKMDRKDAWIRFNEKVKSINGGYGIQAHRSYDKKIPASWSASVMSQDEGMCPVSLGSMKPNWNETANGSNYEAIKKFVASIPDDRVVYLTFHHEPEDNAKRNGYSVPLLQAAFGKFVDAVLAANKPNVHPCFILMSYTFRPESGRNPDDYNMAAKVKPEQLSKVVAGIDGYAHDPDVSAEQTFEKSLTTMGKWGFTRFGIFEVATHSGDKRVKWINDMADWVYKRKNIEVVSWYNSGVGPHAGPQGWFLGTWSKDANGNYIMADGDGSIAAFANLLKPRK